MNLSVAIMAHPRRADFIPELQVRLDQPAEVVWDDGSNSRWGTGRRSMLAYNPAASHHLVVQDDAVIPRDLAAGVETALQHAPQDVPLCLYLGRVRPYREMIADYVKRAEDGASWLVMDQLVWGVAVVMPTQFIEPMVTWCDTQTIPNYDTRMSRWLESQGIPTWYPYPSLVDHRASPSLVPGRGHAGRVAHRFIGEGASALDADYTGAVLRLPDANSYRPGGSTMLFYCENHDNFSIPAARIQFKNHYFEAQTPGQVAHLKNPIIARRRRVRPATEEEAAAWYSRSRSGVLSVAEPAEVEAPAGTVEVTEPAPVLAETTPVEEGVPDGTAADILAWVGTDPARALAAHAVETAGKARKVLLADLDKLARAE